GLQGRGDTAEGWQRGERARIRRWLVSTRLGWRDERAGADVARQRNRRIRQRKGRECIARGRRSDVVPRHGHSENTWNEDASQNPHVALPGPAKAGRV